MRRWMTVAAAVTSLLFAGAPATAGAPAAPRCALPVFGPGKYYHPVIDPAQFSAQVDNPWFPLRPGTTYIYAGKRDKASAIDVYAVSAATHLVDGVRTRVVRDRLFLDGVLHETTLDYYAQDRCRNVWYFGEDTAELDRRGRVVSRDGTFHAGIGGAQPGVYMQADPQLGRLFRQEWLKGVAEDVYKVIGRDERATVPYGTFRNVMRTQETTALEPGVVDNKLYVRGIGQIRELAVRGGQEDLSLVDVLH